MAKTAFVKARIEPELKSQGEAVLSAIGLNTAEAITMFFRQVVMHRGLPFDAKVPNKETLEAFIEGRDPANLKRYPDARTALDDLWDGD